jgi:hypothetical protein
MQNKNQGEPAAGAHAELSSYCAGALLITNVLWGPCSIGREDRLCMYSAAEKRKARRAGLFF